MNRRFFRAALLAVLSVAYVWPQTPAAPASSDRRTATQGSHRSGGAITGSVKDTTGGIIPNATVTLTDQTGKTQTVNTGADGSYRFSGSPQAPIPFRLHSKAFSKPACSLFP